MSIPIYTFFHLLLAFTYTEIYVYIIKLFIPIYIKNILRNPSSAHGLQSPNSRKPFPRDHAHKAIFYYFVLLAKRDRINIIINRSWPTQLYVIFASYLLLLPCKLQYNNNNNYSNNTNHNNDVAMLNKHKNRL